MGLGRSGIEGSHYAESKTAVTEDVVIIGIVMSFVLIVASMMSSFFPSVQRYWKQLCVIFLGLYIGCIILVGNFAYGWEHASVTSHMPYTAHSGKEIVADVGLHIGLRGVNITLKGVPETQEGEKINYNERFQWSWYQGLTGFGPFAQQFNLEYREAQWAGMPYPILNVAEYFTLDGENIIWGRLYRVAGFYTHILMWLALPLWAITFALCLLNTHYAAISSLLTGADLILAVILWHAIRPHTHPLKIPFSGGILEPSYGWTFYLVLSTGIICAIAGFSVLFVEYVDIQRMMHWMTGKWGGHGAPKNMDGMEQMDREKKGNVEMAKML